MSARSSAATLDFRTFYNVVDGELRGAATVYHGIDPRTEEALWDCPVATEEDVEAAVVAATEAFKLWSRIGYERRREMVKRWADAVDAVASMFFELLMVECGKPRGIAEYEVALAVKNIRAYADFDLPSESVKLEDRSLNTRHVPMGVVACICPWNWPVIVAVNKIAPALLTGNCAILKPSPFTPYTGLKLAELGQGFFPRSVLQALGGNDRLGPWLVEHPKIQKISFTGSIPTGKAIMAAASQTLKRVTLELGGNDAMIVCDDVDVEVVAREVVWGAFRNSGQVCVASKRIFIHTSIYESFVACMVARASELTLGPVQNKMQYEKVCRMIENCKAQGYQMLRGGEVDESLEGYFIPATIVGEPPDDSRIVVEEPFGPIIPVQSWSTETEVISRANNTLTGLGACVWSADVARAKRMGAELECGSVWINSYEKPTALACMSGHKESGIGGEGGVQGLLAFCNTQVMHVFE